MGYDRAGFEVVGVDIAPQPRYPFEFHQADAMTFPVDEFDAIHASPPCQDHSALSAVVGKHGTGWMLAATRDRLRTANLPWVIENVPSAPMAPHVVLCGGMFGLRVYRHRRFELGGGWWAMTPGHPPHRVPADERLRIGWLAGHNVVVTGVGGSTAIARAALGIDWMNRAELSQAIPPAYTQFIGEQLATALAVNP